MATTYRQGDVLLTQLETFTPQSDPLPHLVLAQGEATGHAHRISQGEAQLYPNNDFFVLRILSPTALLSHEEHAAIEIPQGDWAVRIQREYEPNAQTFSRFVID